MNKNLLGGALVVVALLLIVWAWTMPVIQAPVPLLTAIALIQIAASTKAQ